MVHVHQGECYAQKYNLPIRIEDTYLEPPWTMLGKAVVRRLTTTEVDQQCYLECTLAAENADGEVCAAFGSVAAALVFLTCEKGCNITWRLD